MTFYTSNADEFGAFTPGIAKRNDDGSIVWQVETTASEEAKKIHISDFGLYLVAPADVIRLNPNDGSEIWNVTSSVTLGFDLHPTNGKLYYGRYNRAWSSVDYADGTNKSDFTHTTSGLNFAEPVNDIAISPGGRVYISTRANNAILEVDPDTGAELNRIFFAGGAIGPTGINAIRFHDGVLYAAGYERNASGTPGGIKSFDLDLTTATDVTLAGDCRAFNFSGDFVYWLDTENSLLRKTSLIDGSDEWTVAFDSSESDSASTLNAIGSDGTTVAHIDAALNVRIRNASDGTLIDSITRSTGDGFGAIEFVSRDGPTTNEELFNASYADASAADPKVTALIRPADVQRSIDTDVSNLKDGPNLYTVEAIFDIGELSNLNPYNSTTEKPRVFFVKDDQPGLRDGKNLLLKGYQIRSADPSVPVTCTFWGY